MNTTLTTMQVASALSVSFATIERLARQRVLKTVARHRFNVETVRAFVASGTFDALRAAGRIA